MNLSLDPRIHRIVAAQPYPLLFATISGAHLYGFQSPDSDLDLRGAHVLPLEKVVGLEVRDETIEQSMIVPPDTSSGRRPPSPQIGEGDGALEMDIVSHELRKFFSLPSTPNAPAWHGRRAARKAAPVRSHST